MAVFLQTDGISLRLHQLINNSNETLILISPYLRISERIKRLLEDKESLEKIQIWVVYGKEDLKPAEDRWLKSRTGIRSKFIQNMHTKCYLNEGEAIVTSMNLYDFSQINNYEMGIYVTKDGDPNLYRAIHDVALGYLDVRDVSKTSVEEVHYGFDKASKPTCAVVRFCIRCRREMRRPSDTSPYCPGCGNDWQRDGSDVYQEERFCHICGIQKGHITKARPACYECYRRPKDSLESAPVPARSSAR